MADSYLINLSVQDSEPTRSIVLQRWLRQACINAGISIMSSDPYLRNLVPNDSEPVRAVVIQRWLTLLAQNIGGGGGGSTVRAGNVVLAANDTQKAVAFASPFGSVPAVSAGLVTPDGTVIPVSISAVDANGFTALWGTPLAAGYLLTWQAVATSQ